MATTATKEEDLQWPVSKWESLIYKIGYPKVNIMCLFSECYFTVCIKITLVTFDVRKSVHHHTIQINQPTRCNSFTSLLLDVYAWLNMFRAPLRPSSGAYNCTRRSCGDGVSAWPARPRPTMLRPPRSNGRTRGS